MRAPKESIFPFKFYLIPQLLLLQITDEQHCFCAGKIKAGSSNISHSILIMQFCQKQTYSSCT